MGGSPNAPDLPEYPGFAGTQIYDGFGNLTGSITKDASGNIVYRAGALSAAEQINQKAIEQKKQSLLQRIYSTPAEYTKAAEEEASAWATEQSKRQTDQFTKDVNRIGEVSNQRGLYGSSAMADITGQREKTLAETGASIAGSATAMRQGLLQNKIGQDYNLYNLYAGAGNDYSNKAMQNLQATAGLSGQINSYNQNAYGQQVNALNSQYQNRMNSWSQNEPWRNYIMPLIQSGATAAGGLAAVGAFASDRRLKKSIIPLFKIGDVQWYEFEYDSAKWPEGVVSPTPGKHVGVMADEVRHIPGVVAAEMFYGFDMVNYDVLRRHLFMENA